MKDQETGRAVVLGGGSSGLAAARLLRSEGWSVEVVDSAPAEAWGRPTAAFEEAGCRLHPGARGLPSGEFDLAVASPGIPADAPLFREASAATAVLPELELGASRLRGPLLAITGTAGKSTAVRLASDILVAAGLDAPPCGNYGTPLSDIARLGRADAAVVEASSFQLETTRSFRAEAAVLLNCHPNHLDRHGTMDAYANAKARIFVGSREGDACIVPFREERDWRRRGGGGTWMTFGEAPGADYRLDGLTLITPAGSCELPAEAALVTSAFRPLIPAVAAAVRRWVEAPSAVAEAVAAFRPLPHRMARLGEWGGVEWIEDSKSTCSASLRAALAACAGRRVRLIAGGRPKELDFSALGEAIARTCAGVYLIGEAAALMERDWLGAAPVQACGTLDVALTAAQRDARPGETVLFSPACASFDQFSGYAERGDRMIAWVNSLRNRAENEKRNQCKGDES
jgi:UDP-N-acetylmuramoylalanine--D-glutamate ligase